MKIKQTIKDRLVNFTVNINYWLNNYNEVIWLIGNGRSGTTWISSLINHDKKYREMFEPFHPQLMNETYSLLPHQYVRSDEYNKELEKIASDIFSGKFANPRVDSSNSSLFYKGIIVKDIFANLLAHWASLNFPQVKTILLIRNPFSVTLSTYKKKDWFWMTEPMDFLSQTALFEDYLQPFEDIIRKTSAKNDYVLSQILIWSVINYVPLRQFKPGQLHISFYEDIVTDPNYEVTKIFKFSASKNKNSKENIDNKIITRPSRVTGTESNILDKSRPVTSWKNELTSHQIDAGFEILQHFGFADLYDENSKPNRHVINKIHAEI